MHPDLLFARKFVYDVCGFTFSNFAPEKESQEYAACDFTLNHIHIKFRVAKTTPTKVGQFVTLWKRNSQEVTCPYNAEDPIDLFVISVRKENLIGQFVFPKSAFIRQGVLTNAGKDGKRGFRVYPPWEKQLNKQALKTQNWQKEFFIEINEKDLDKERLSTLYGLKTI